ncbi:UNKNOWN [Stylonychia lemnae]|uniref:Transmembrane protein n=1 Tax=Stylonychia lemnae TaxID=5949 RepID=A0A078AEV6_STYLE|nr:UNKNOWN [Stylonychia lemnae]|eukprot:CDW80042.1 UNKNOWN [Stylonychia lemnae]
MSFSSFFSGDNPQKVRNERNPVQSSLNSRQKSVLDKLFGNGNEKKHFYERLQKPFKQTFIASNQFDQYNKNNLIMNLKDKKSGFKIVPQVTQLFDNQPLKLKFLFQKKHSSLTQKTLSMKSILKIDDPQDIALQNYNYFNYYLDVDNPNLSFNRIFISNQFNILPDHDRFYAEFLQTIAFQQNNMNFGARINYLRDKYVHLFAYKEAAKYRLLFDLNPAEIKVQARCLYMNLHYELLGINANCDFKNSRYEVDLLHSHPLTNKELTNFYALYYTDLNIVVYYVNLAIQGAFSIPIAYLMVKKISLETSQQCLLEQFLLLEKEKELTGYFSLCTAKQPLKLNKLILTFATLPLGIMLSILLQSVIYTRDDGFFYNEDQVKYKTLAYFLVAFSEQIENDKKSISIKKFFKLKVNYGIMFSFGLLTAVFYFQLQKWPHITNQFNFTPLSQTIYNILRFVRSYMQVKLSYLYQQIKAVGVMLGTLSKANVGLTTFLAFMIGFFLAALLITIYMQCQHLIEKENINCFLIYGGNMAVGGILSMVITIVGDKIHYMNRDIKTWIYFAEGLIILLVSIAFFIMMCLTRAM